MNNKKDQSIAEKAEELYEAILDMLFPKRVAQRKIQMEKQRKRAAEKKAAADEAEKERKHKARVSGRGIFWNKRPYHPSMGANYRDLLTAIGVDSRRTTRIYHPRCGTDMCTIAERSGPYIQYYIPPDDNTTEIAKNIAFNQLTNKIDRISDIIELYERAAFCHLFPIVNTPDMEFEEFCKNLYNKTVDDGYIIVSEFVPVEGEESILDKHDFVFPYDRTPKVVLRQKFLESREHDHSEHWEEILDGRLKEMQSEVCLESLPEDIDLLKGFHDELKRWIVILKLIQDKKIRVLTRVYKREAKAIR
ncbi:hypothetical protein [Pseudemcibacter aquimaris]|uniref:hypothetical protein n=1 Tax=Pseudemcibacter aquimaris TaxID=2857064 RepID=UPI00201284CD|nr:hypothetical protein [Pseudemcibacter aquimaris]MCC3861029.1 hypothetical protein [Pseudemcibacter aquimaris]WDU59847.1 hypothetical protein KW060_06205 [Pseudemcibacter aquimaris]